MTTQSALLPTKDPLAGFTPASQTPYLLYYRQGNNPHAQFFVFYHASKDMKTITARVKRHCEVMNYRFVYVRPLVVDLDREENFLTSSQE